MGDVVCLRVEENMISWKHHKSQIGQELVEFALLLPLLLLLLFGLIEVGLVVLNYNTVANIGREVARYGTINPEPDLIQQYITDTVMSDTRRFSFGLQPSNLTVDTVLEDHGPLLSTITVTVSYDYSFLTAPIIAMFSADPTIDLQATSTMYTERVPILP
jgi:Flp pilus assembly protein TadG